ncbi:hypothetical protein [Geobacillus kaustophilus]|uniref:hypothetical protein n=1 Tax=Geobacillus kaustophilus TaxID=1462 RepID=UPI0012E09EFE|nr:hypothetical protein [Geobacillus kaustophilus]
MNIEQRLAELEQLVAKLEKKAADEATVIKDILPKPLDKERFERLISSFISRHE